MAAYSIQLVKDPNAITYHLLESMSVHLQKVKQIPPHVVNGGGDGGPNNHQNIAMFNSNAPFRRGQPQYFEEKQELGRVENRILAFIAKSGSPTDGVFVGDIVASLRDVVNEMQARLVFC